MKVKTGLKAGKKLGDRVADLTQMTGLDQLAKTYTRITGRDCGCDQRRQRLNQLTPK
ncbi:MAG: hypothetical protein AAF639_04060 [Chloroflexota bacterium]